MLHNNLTF